LVAVDQNARSGTSLVTTVTVVTLRHSGRRHPVALAAAALLSVLIAAPFTAPFSACSLTMFLSASNQGRAGARATAAVPVVAPAKAARGSHSDGSVLTEEQLKDDATPQETARAEVLLSTIVRTVSSTSATALARIIPAVLRV